MNADKTLILGVGNILLGDEGFGVHALRYLEANYAWPAHVKLVDGGTLGLMLMAELLECQQVVILDIATCGKRPGTFYRLDQDDLSKSLSFGNSLHHTGIEDVLISCKMADHCPRATVFAMEPYDFQNISADLTSQAREKLPVFCAKVLEGLAEMGIYPMEKQADFQRRPE